MRPIRIRHLVGVLAAAGASVLGGSSQRSHSQLTFVAVSAGGAHTCGVTVAGAAYCWGGNFEGQLGQGVQLGDGAPGPELCRVFDVAPPCSTIPVPVTGGVSFTAISAGGTHTCGLTVAGAAYCWGSNSQGQLGDGTTSDRWSPVPVAGGLSFAGISAGKHYTCGVTAAGAAYCWGGNYSGQLGDGTTTARSSPVRVSGRGSFAAVSAGDSHTCGLTAAGAVFCWGWNLRGQLGSSSNGRLGYDARGPELCGGQPCSTVPVRMPGSLRFTAVSPGFHYTCGVTAAGTAYCWGDNESGALGDGTRTERSSPVPVTGGVTFAAVSAGGEGQHTCGVTAAGAAYCWGGNSYGQLGDATTTDRSSPVLVAGDLSFTTVSAGSHYTCGVAVAGAAYCWGNSGAGQLGDGTKRNPLGSRSSPVTVRQ